MSVRSLHKLTIHIITCVLIFTSPIIINAQNNSRGFNYQAIARDKSGQPLINKDIVIEVSIRSGSATGPIVWQEGHEVITNQFGLFTVVIGRGITTGLGSLSSFYDIPWSVGDYYVRIRVDIANGLVDMGTSKLQAVPYAMIADSVRNYSAYAVGTGITLFSNTISHTPHTGDATGIVNLSVVGLQNRPLNATAPGLNEVIKWNGAAWAPSSDDNTIYSSGTGITISGTSISHLSHTGDATGSDAITVTGIQGRSVSATAPNNGEVLKWNGANWIPAVDDNTAYTAGTGIVLTGTAFSHDSHSGDATGITTLTVTGLQGRPLLSNAPLNGEVIKWNGTDWAPATDASNEYAAGAGLTLNLNTFTVLPHTHTGDVFGQTSLTVQGFQGRAISANGPLDGEVLKWSNFNMQWEPAPDLSSTYTAGTGIIINTNTISATNSLAIWNASKLMGNDISSVAPNNGDLLSWNGTAWIPTVPPNNYDAGLGITLTANSFSHTAHTGDATGITSLIVVALQGRAVSAIAPANNEILKWNGANWAPAADNNNVYAAGTGLLLSSNTFFNTGDLSSTNEIQNLSYTTATRTLNITSGTSATLPLFTAASAGLVNLSGGGTTNYLRADGSWAAPVGTTYSAGTGLTLSGTTFSHTAHSGDATGNTSLRVVAIQGRNVSTAAPAGNDVLKWNGAVWAPATDNNTQYAAGTGLSLSSNTFTNTGDLSSANELQDLSYTAATRTLNISSGTGTTLPLFNATADGLTPLSGGGTINYLRADGSWTIPAGTTYDAGIGITLTANTFSHAPHTGDATGATSLTVVALQGRSVSAVAPAANEILKWNGANWAPAVDDNTTYDAGTGITLSGNTFLHADHTGDATGSTSLTVVALQGKAVSTVVPAANEVLKWDGTSWAPAIDNNSLYAAGTGLTLNSNTFFNTGDLSSSNELQNLTYTAITRTINISSGGGTTLPLFNAIFPGLVGGSGGGSTNFLRADGSWTAPAGTTYSAGTGLTLTGTTFSHTAHTGDATGNTSLRVVALQGRNVSTAAPAGNDVLKWNGAAWAPATDNNTLYAAGTGLSLSSNTFTNTGDLSSVNELQDLSYTAATRTLNISSGTSTVLPLFTPASAGLVNSSGGGTTNYLRADGTWTAPVGTTYTSGIGITLAGNTFSHTAHSGDATGTTSLTVVALQGRSVSAVAPAANEILKWNGASWSPAADNNTSYAAGTGLTLNSNTFTNTGDLSSVNELQNLSYTAATRTLNISSGAGTILPLFNAAADGLTPLSGGGTTNYLRADGTWAAPVGTAYAAGAGITLAGNTFSHAAHTGDAIGSTSLTVVALQGNAVSVVAPAANEILKWNGAAWTPAADANNAYAAGTGITLAGNTFSHAAHTGDATGSTSLTVVALQGNAVSVVAPAANEILKWNGAAWTPAADANNAYAAGTGITLAGNTFSHAAHTGDATGSTSLTVVALQGNAVSVVAPAANEILKWNGAAWTPAADANNAYAAGTGITLAGNTFSHAAHTGDATGSTSLTVVALQGNAVSVVAPAANEILKWNGAAWTPAADANNAYAAGTGITLAGNTFSHAAHTGDATGITSLTVVALQGNAVSVVAPAANEILKWNGAAWTPSADANNAYAAGTGITLAGNTFSHAAHTGDATGSTSLTVVALQGNAVSAIGPAANEVLKWNGAAWTPAADNNNTYAAGTGITLAANTFFHAAHTGDATGSTSLTVVALQGNAVSAIGPAANEVLKWNGAAWTPAADNNNTYAAGTGITLAANTFFHAAHTGDATGTTSLTVVALQGNTVAAAAPAANEILKWNGAAWTPAADANTTYAAGTGITLTGTTFSHTAHTGDATGTTSLTVVALQGNAVSAVGPAANEILKWNGAAWTPAADANTNYAAGTGITLTGTTFSHTAHTGDATGTTSLTVVALQGNAVSAVGPAANEILKWNGAAWTPAADANTTYDAGTGITLTGNTFSHTAHTGDATGTTSLTVVALQGNAVAAAAPAANEILKWNGAAWTPAADANTTYAAGTGITLTGTTFSHTAHTGDATGTTSLTVVALQGNTVAAAAPAANEILKWNGAAWTPAADANTTYAAGTGITLTGTTFSHTAHTGDATGTTSLTVVALQGNAVSAVGPAANEILKWNGAAWTPAADANTNYAAGTGITLTGTTFSHTAHTGDATGTTSLTVVALQGNAVSAVGPAANEILKWNGAAWTPAADANTTYDAGTGITLTGNTFSHTAHTGDATGTTSLTVVALQGNAVAAAAPAANEILKWNGASWAPAADANTTYAAGTGITLTGTTFSHTAHTGDATGTTSLTVVALQGNAVAAAAPAANEILKWNGASWAPAADANTTYAAGTGITLTGTTFSHTAHTGDATGTTSLTVVALQGNAVAAAAPAANEILKWNGAAWAPAADANTTYAAGTGITLTGTTFSHTAHTGDATGTTSLTVVALQGNAVAAAAPAANEILKWNGATWTPAADANTTYDAGTGITLTGTTFSHTAHTGDATGTTSLTVVALQGNAVAAAAPAANEILKWNGAAWTPAADANTTYAAGTGITLTGTTFSHTAHTGDATGTTSLTVVALQGNAVAAAAPAANEILKWNGATWTPAADANTTYAAGTGITLTGNTFSHTAHTGDATGTTSLTVVALQGNAVAAAAPAANEILKWNGAAWTPAADANTTYAAGTGITLTGNTFSHTAHTGDATGTTSLTVVALQGNAVAAAAPAANEILKWNGAAWTPAADANTTYAAGTGITLTGTTFSHTAHTGDATGTTSLTVVALQGNAVSAVGPAANEILKWNGAAWTPAADANTTYAAGTGITLTGTTFSHTAHTGDATGTTSLTVVALQGNAVAAAAPAANEILKWNGATWTPAADANTTYAAGTGITLTGTTFSHTAHTGDATGTTSLTVVALQGNAVSAVGPAANEILKWNGAAWTPAADANTTYAAGTGITLTGTTFSHTAHTGDATGTTSLTVVALQGNAVSAVGPAANEILKWNGAAWTPAADANTTYAAGTGITLTGTTFSHTAHTGDATGTTSLTVVALQGNAVSAVGPAANEILKWNGAAWTPAADANTTYAAGTGITLTGTTFSHTAHTGDATGTTSLTVVALQGNAVSAVGPAANEILKWNGAAWTPAADANTTYAAGTGITLTGTTFSHTAHTGDATGTTSLTVVALQGNAVAAAAPAANEILKWNGAAWTPAADANTTYAAGTGITLTGTTFSHTAHTGDATGTTSLTVVALQGNSVSAVAPAANEILKWNGAAWTPAADAGTTYAAGIGITLTGTTFSHTAHTGDATGTTSLTVVALQGRSVSAVAPNNGEMLGWNGATWIPTVPASNPYTSGLGITLTGNTFSHTAHTGDATGTTSLTVVALQGRSVSAAAPSGGDVLGWNGAAWTPTAVAAISYAAGTGLTLNSNTFINTGDLSSTNEIQDLSYTAGTRALGITSGTGITMPLFSTGSTDAGLVTGSNSVGATYYLNGNGTWSVPLQYPYVAGVGLTMTTGTFDHTPHTGDATGATSLTVVALQGKSVASITPSDRNILTWVNASSRWEPKLLTTLADANNDTKITVEDSPNEDIIRFSTNGSERMQIAKNGYIGIATSSPTSTLTSGGSFAYKVSVYATNPPNLNLDDTISYLEVTGNFGNLFLPLASTCPGRIYIINHTGLGNTNLRATGINNIDGAPSVTVASSRIRTVLSNGVNDWYTISLY